MIHRFAASVVLTVLLVSLATVAGCGGGGGTVAPVDGVVTHAPAATSDEVATAVRRAGDELAARNYSAVVTLLERYQKVADAPVKLFEYLGEAWLNMAAFEKSEGALAEGLRRDLYSKKIRELLSSLNYVRGRLALEARQYADARSFFERSIVNTPTDRTLITNVAGLYRGEGERLAASSSWADCARIMGDAHALGLGGPATDLALGRALKETSRPREALEAVDRFLASSPGDVQGLLLKGDVMAALDRPSEALDAWKRIQETDPDNFEVRERIRGLRRTVGNVHFVNAEAAIEAEDWNRAAAELEEALKTVTNASSDVQQGIYEKLGFVWDKLNDFAKALNFYRYALVSAPDDVALNLETARLLRLSNRLAEAQSTLERLLSRHPTDPAIRLAMADFYVQIKLPGNAVPHLEALMARGEGEVPRDTLLKALWILGVCYAQRKQYDKAEEAWLALLDLDPGNAKVYHNLGLIYEHQSRFGRAIEYFEQACQTASSEDPAFSRYLYWLAVAFRQNGQLTHYRQTLEKIVQVCPLDDPYRSKTVKFLESLGWSPVEKADGPPPAPNSPEALVQEADTAAQRGELAQARTAYEAIVAREDPPAPRPVLARALRGLGLLESTEKRHATAVVDFLRALEVAPRDRATLLGLGQAYEALGLPADAAAVYRRAGGGRDGADQQVRFQLGRALAGDGNIDEAVEVLDGVVNDGPRTLAAEQAKRMVAELEPRLTGGGGPAATPALTRRRARALRLVASALADAGLVDQARDFFRRARELGGDDVETVLGEARLLEREGRRDEAVASLERASAAAPRDTRILVDLAGMLYRKGDTARSEATFRSALEVDPSNQAAAFALVDICRATGRPDEGRKVLEALVRSGVAGQTAEQARELLRTLGS